MTVEPSFCDTPGLGGLRRRRRPRATVIDLTGAPFLQRHVDLGHRGPGLGQRQVHDGGRRVRRREDLRPRRRRPARPPPERARRRSRRRSTRCAAACAGPPRPPPWPPASDPSRAARPPPWGSASKISPGPALVPTGAPRSATAAAAGETMVADAAAAPMTPVSVSSVTPGARNPAIGAAASRCGITSGSGAGVGSAAGQRAQAGGQAGGVEARRDVGRGGAGQHVVERPERGVVRQRLPDPGRQRAHGGVGDEGHRAGHRLVEHERQRVDVGPAVDRLALGRLGRDVARRAHHGARRLGPGRLGQGPGHAEVGHPHPALLVEEEVGRLDVAVHQAPRRGRRPGPGPPRSPAAAAWECESRTPRSSRSRSEPPPRYSSTR